MFCWKHILLALYWLIKPSTTCKKWQCSQWNTVIIKALAVTEFKVTQSRTIRNTLNPQNTFSEISPSSVGAKFRFVFKNKHFIWTKHQINTCFYWVQKELHENSGFTLINRTVLFSHSLSTSGSETRSISISETVCIGTEVQEQLEASLSTLLCTFCFFL